ncbi:MAG: ATP-grasp domain-containing protein [Planctomycetales bacterium]
MMLEASRRAEQAAAALRVNRGYCGVDVILADDPANDVVVEVNPRLTTSYVGLRSLCRANLAKAMLDAAVGVCPEVDLEDWKMLEERAVTFTADGCVRRTQTVPAGERRDS